MYLSILALPMFGSAIAGLRGRSIGVTGAHIVTTGCLTLSAILAIVAFYEVGLCGSPVSIELFSWIDSEFMLVTWGFLFDSLTVSIRKEGSLWFVSHLALLPVSKLAKRWKIETHKNITPNTICKDIIIWDIPYTLGLTINIKASTFVRAFTGLPTYVESVIIGLLLSDGHI